MKTRSINKINYYLSDSARREFCMSKLVAFDGNLGPVYLSVKNILAIQQNNRLQVHRKYQKYTTMK